MIVSSLHVTHFSDPGCPWAWSASPALAALQWRYGDQLDWRHVMIGLTENGAVYEKRGYTPAGQARGYRNFRERGMPFATEPRETRPRHVADVPRRRRHPPARPRARVRRLPRAAVRAVHEHRVPRGPRDAARRRSPGCPGIDADAIIAAANDPETERVFEADRDEARTAEGSPTEFQGKSRQHRRPRALHGAEPQVHERQASRSRPAASSPSRPMTC